MRNFNFWALQKMHARTLWYVLLFSSQRQNDPFTVCPSCISGSVGTVFAQDLT